MDKPKIRFLISVLMDSGIHLSMSLNERMLRLSRLLKSCPSKFSAEECDGEEETDMGYETSWSGIFQIYERGD